MFLIPNMHGSVVCVASVPKKQTPFSLTDALVVLRQLRVSLIELSVLSALHDLTHLIPQTSLSVRYYYDPY